MLNIFFKLEFWNYVLSVYMNYMGLLVLENVLILDLYIFKNL